MSLALIILKLTLVPLLIGAITLAGRKWGPTVAGWLSGMPVVAGPIMFFMALEQGAPFAQEAIVGMLLGVLAVLGFNLIYAWSSTRFSWHGSLLCSLSGYFTAVLLLNTMTVSLQMAAILVLVSLLAAPPFFPAVRVRPMTLVPARSEIFIRMFAGALLVVSVTLLASTFGAHLSGLFATFPVISMVLAVFSHRQCGHEFAVNLLRGIVFGWYAFLVFCFVLGLMLSSFSIAHSFMAAIAGTAAAQIMSRVLIRRR